MRSFQRKVSLKQILHSRLVLLILGLILLFFAYNLLGLLGKMRDTARNKEVAKEKYEELQANKEKLSEDIVKLSTKEGVEENIRDKFGLVKEGEGVVIIVEEKEENKAQLEANSSGFFNFFKNLFK